MNDASAMAASRSLPSICCISPGLRKKSFVADDKSSKRTTCDVSSSNASINGSRRYGASGMTWPYSESIHSSAFFASASSTDLRNWPTPWMILSETAGYFRKRFCMQTIDSACRTRDRRGVGEERELCSAACFAALAYTCTLSMSISRNFISCSTIKLAHSGTRTPILPIDETAPPRDGIVDVGHILGELLNDLAHVLCGRNRRQDLELQQFDARRVVVAAVKVLKLAREDGRRARGEQRDVLQAREALLEAAARHEGEHRRLEPLVDLGVDGGHVLRELRKTLVARGPRRSCCA